MEYDIVTINKKTKKKHVTKYCYKKGTQILHCETGPALEYNDGSKEWYFNGHHHREDGPAIEYANGYKAWYKSGQLHRENGPAIEMEDFRSWWLNGERHRENGPAVEDAEFQDYHWYVHGTRIAQQKEEILNIWWKNNNEKNSFYNRF